MKKVLITGATGFVGGALSRKLFLDGYSLVFLSRDPHKAREKLGLPGEYYAESEIEKALVGVDAMVHLSGESVAARHWTDEVKAQIRDSRVVTTRKWVQAANQAGVKQWIGASAIGIYGDQGDRELEEEEGPGNDFLAQVCQEWEEASQAFLGKRTILRIGVVLGRSRGNLQGALEKLLPLFQTGLGGRLGNGKQWMSWIDLDDLVGIIEFCLKSEALTDGVFNATSPGPVTNAEFSKSLSQALGMFIGPPAPRAVVETVMGERSSVLFASQRVNSKKIEKAGYLFKSTNLDLFLRELLLPESRGERVFYSGHWINKSLNEVFEFFSKAQNLEKITPEWLHFKILRMSTSHIQSGTEIDYELKLYGVKMKWRTLIEEFEPQKRFRDVQLKGPYQKWDHEHTFFERRASGQSEQGGVWMEDRVIYKLPLGTLGRLFGGRIVKSQVQEIFDYRRKIIEKEFG